MTATLRPSSWAFVTAAGRGAGFATLFSVWEDLRQHRLDPMADSPSWMQIGLEIKAGMMLSEVIAPEEVLIGRSSIAAGTGMSDWQRNCAACSADAGINLAREPNRMLDPVISARILIIRLVDRHWNAQCKGLADYPLDHVMKAAVPQPSMTSRNAGSRQLVPGPVPLSGTGSAVHHATFASSSASKTSRAIGSAEAGF